MATAIAHISWPPVVGSEGYLIEYKERSSSIWITPGPPTEGANPTLYTNYDLTITQGILYDLRISSKCANGSTKYRFTTLFVNTPVVYIWVEDTYTCAQDNVFTQISQVTGLSSPNRSYYYAPQGRMYVVDNDDTGGIFWWFDPNTFTSPAGRNYISGTNTLTNAYITVVDRQYNRLYATGLFSSGGGLLVYDIPSDTVSTVPFGTNSSFSRVGIAIGTNLIYCNDAATDSIIIINRASLTINSTVSLPSVPTGPGGRTISSSAILTEVNNEIWVVEDGGSTNDYILRYSTDLSTFIGFLDISAFRGIWQLSAYWGKCYYDQPKSKFYVTDIRNSSIVVVETVTPSVVGGISITNLEGYQGLTLAFVTDPITGDLYASGFESNPTGTPTPPPLAGANRTYLLDRDVLFIKQLYPNLSFQQLERVGSTNILFGMTPNLRRWDGGAWNTDGIVTKFSR